MLSYKKLRDTFGALSQNTSTANLALFDTLANIEHRYLLQEFFSNETTYSIPTAGGSTATLTGALSIGAITATLTSAWTGNNTKVQVTFSSGEIRMVNVITGSAVIKWDVPLTIATTTTITIGGQQYYPLPPNYSKLKSITITIGALQWTLNEVFTTQEWNQLNVFPYYADIPKNFFIYPGGDHGAQIGIWPIPATSGNIITFSYKFRVPDLSLTDYDGTSGGTGISVATKSTAVTGATTTFVPTTNVANESRWLQIAQPKGDNTWYQIVSVDSATALTLYQPYQGITVTTATSYTIGQMPLLMEDFHDMLLYKPLYTYFSSINPDKVKAAEFKELYDERLLRLAKYSGKNSINVNLRGSINTRNPNTFPQSIGGQP
jgi:hypothetical protein